MEAGLLGEHGDGNGAGSRIFSGEVEDGAGPGRARYQTPLRRARQLGLGDHVEPGIHQVQSHWRERSLHAALEVGSQRLLTCVMRPARTLMRHLGEKVRHPPTPGRRRR
jgi:hypothetical protein